MSSSKNTNINWITVPRTGEKEYQSYQKSFFLDRAVDKAVIRFESDCVCAVFVNGEFVISGTGRYPERVNCHEVTSKLHRGENTIELLLGGHYFQGFGREAKKKRGFWLSQAALELSAELADQTKLQIPTDDSWMPIDLEEDLPLLQTMQVTRAEYDTMWKNAALWQETDGCGPVIAKEVLSVVGQEYETYACRKREYVVPCTEIVFSERGSDECTLIADMGRTVVGYVEFAYAALSEVTVTCQFDVSEQLEDFLLENELAGTVKRLTTTDSLDATEHFYRNIRRRAFRYVKLTFKGEMNGFDISGLGVRLCMFPEKAKGWFSCSDEMLSRAWEVGKYTLHANKQQEYESCPRCEMLFFAGDGAVDALVDLYAFGDCDMLNTSLSIKHEESANGISKSRKFNRTVWQWDYFAWRIICVYNYYQLTGDRDFLERHYEEIVGNILWLTERMNDRDLLFQIPAFHSTFSSTLIQVDWACSTHRMGENVFLNCLLYKSLVCMSRVANDMEDTERANQWKDMADRVKKAINEKLWKEEKGAYVDGLSEHICQDANTFAVLFGVADEDRARQTLATIKESLWSEYGSAMADADLSNGDLRGGKRTISPMMSAREAEARFRTGQPEEGLELIRRVWGTMLRKGATTFWEFSPNNETQRWTHTCHAWSAGCTYLLSAYVLGVRPASADWKSIVFAPRPCDLKWGKGVVPTSKGLIAVVWETGADRICRFTMALPREIKLCEDLPENCTVEVIRY